MLDFYSKLYGLNVLCVIPIPISGPYSYEEEKFIQSLPAGNVEIGKWFQSYNYFKRSERLLRQNLQINEKYRATAKETLYNLRLSLTAKKKGDTSSQNIVFVGVHIRLKDYLSQKNYDLGFRTAPKVYIVKAMEYYWKTYGTEVNFVIVSDDLRYCRANFEHFPAVHFVTLGSAALDLALLAQCDHTIITSGTFGYWGAWLNGGDVVYFDKPVEKNSLLGETFEQSSFFTPYRIPVSEPSVTEY